MLLGKARKPTRYHSIGYDDRYLAVAVTTTAQIASGPNECKPDSPR